MDRPDLEALDPNRRSRSGCPEAQGQGRAPSQTGTRARDEGRPQALVGSVAAETEPPGGLGEHRSCRR